MLMKILMVQTYGFYPSLNLTQDFLYSALQKYLNLLNLMFQPQTLM